MPKKKDPGKRQYWYKMKVVETCEYFTTITSDRPLNEEELEDLAELNRVADSGMKFAGVTDCHIFCVEHGKGSQKP